MKNGIFVFTLVVVLGFALMSSAVMSLPIQPKDAEYWFPEEYKKPEIIVVYEDCRAFPCGIGAAVFYRIIDAVDYVREISESCEVYGIYLMGKKIK